MELDAVKAYIRSQERGIRMRAGAGSKSRGGLLALIAAIIAAIIVIVVIVVVVVVVVTVTVARFRGPNELVSEDEYNPCADISVWCSKDEDGDYITKDDVVKYFEPPIESIESLPLGTFVVGKFLGANSIYLFDGYTGLLIDPYFTRVSFGLGDLLGREIQPDPVIIRKTLSCADITQVDAILLTHAHYDHALDIAMVQSNYGSSPEIVGSKSVYYIAKGGDVRHDFITVVDGASNSISFGYFHITFLKSRHARLPWPWSAEHGGEITSQIVPPAHITDYNEGGTFALRIYHELLDSVIVIQGSANYDSDVPLGEDVDVLILGIAGFEGILNNDYFRNDYYHHVVEKTNAKKIIFTHWDDFKIRLDEPQKWFYDPLESREFFANKDNEIVPQMMPMWDYVLLLIEGEDASEALDELPDSWDDAPEALDGLPDSWDDTLGGELEDIN